MLVIYRRATRNFPGIPTALFVQTNIRAIPALVMLLDNTGCLRLFECGRTGGLMADSKAWFWVTIRTRRKRRKLLQRGRGHLCLSPCRQGLQERSTMSWTRSQERTELRQATRDKLTRDGFLSSGILNPRTIPKPNQNKALPHSFSNSGSGFNLLSLSSCSYGQWRSAGQRMYYRLRTGRDKLRTSEDSNKHDIPRNFALVFGFRINHFMDILHTAHSRHPLHRVPISICILKKCIRTRRGICWTRDYTDCWPRILLSL